MLNNKFLYLKHRTDFESVLLLIPTNLNPIIFIEDTNLLWTCNHWFSIGYPSITATLDASQANKVKLNLGTDSSVLMITTGNGLSLFINKDGAIEFQSLALTTINTKFPLEYSVATNTISHSTYGSKGSYGNSTDLSNTRSFYIPYLTIDEYGHIKSAQQTEVSISLETKQFKLNNESHRLLLSTTNSDNEEIGNTYKSNIIYNADLLTIPTKIESTGGITINNGNVEIKGEGVFIGKFQGDVTGSATPKIHSSLKLDYGGASTLLFGHVKLLDTIPDTDPGSSSDNSITSDVTNAGKEAIAATPKMVYDAVSKIKLDEFKSTAYDTDGLKKNTLIINFTKDFELDSNNNLSIRVEEIRE